MKAKGPEPTANKDNITEYPCEKVAFKLKRTKSKLI